MLKLWKNKKLLFKCVLVCASHINGHIIKLIKWRFVIQKNTIIIIIIIILTTEHNDKATFTWHSVLLY